MPDKYDELAGKIWDDDEFSDCSGEYWTGTGERENPGLAASTRLAALLRESENNPPALPLSWQDAVREAVERTEEFFDGDGNDVEQSVWDTRIDERTKAITSALAPLVEALKRPLELMVLWDKAENEDWKKYDYMQRIDLCRAAFAEASAALALLEKEETSGE